MFLDELGVTLGLVLSRLRPLHAGLEEARVALSRSSTNSQPYALGPNMPTSDTRVDQPPNEAVLWLH